MATLTNTVHDANLSTALADATWTGDTVRIDRYDDKYTDGLDHSTEDVAGLSFLAGYTGAVEGSPLLFTCSAGSVVFRCRSKGPIRCGSNAITQAWLNMYGDMLSAEPVQVMAACWVKNAYLSAGNFEFYDVVKMGALVINGARVHVRRSGTNTTTGNVTVNSGSIQVDRDPADVVVNGGTLTIDHETCSPTTLTINGGTVRVRVHGGTFPSVTLNAGTLDLSGVSGPLTITASVLGDPKSCRVIMPADTSLITWSSNTLATLGDPRYQAA